MTCPSNGVILTYLFGFRDPQEHPHGPHLGLHDVSPAQQESSSRYPAVGDRGSAPYTSGFTEHNAQVTGSSPKGNIGKQGWSQSTHQLQSIPPAVQALAALLSNSKLSSSDVTHLQSLANSQHTGNLGQLAAQLEMAIQLASSSQAQGHSSELRAQTQSFPEATHRVQIPAAQLMDRSAARVGSGAHVPSGPPVVAPAAFAAPTDTAKAASRQQPPKADKAAAHRLRQEPVSALDLVAEVAAAVEENNEPSELLM